MTDMAALVTGASGFLGGALTRALVRRGDQVRILVRPSSHLGRLRDLPVDIRYGRLEELAGLEPILQGVDVVYHCAALASDWAPWREFRHANIIGVHNMLRTAAAAGVRRFVHISTTDVYGYPRRPCDESHPLADIGLPYNRSKVAGEQIVWNFVRQTGLPTTVIRPATIYGPSSVSCVGEIAALLLRGRMVHIGRGRSGAGLLYIDNAVTGILQAARSSAAVGQAYNLRDEDGTTWKGFVDSLALGLGVSCPVRSIPVSLAWALAYVSEAVYTLLRRSRRPLLTRHAVRLFSRDQNYPIHKAQRDFGFRSEIKFAQGIERSLTRWQPLRTG